MLNLSRNQLLSSAVLEFSTRKGKVVYGEAALDDPSSTDDNDDVPGPAPQKKMSKQKVEETYQPRWKKGDLPHSHIDNTP